MPTTSLALPVDPPQSSVVIIARRISFPIGDSLKFFTSPSLKITLVYWLFVLIKYGFLVEVASDRQSKARDLASGGTLFVHLGLIKPSWVFTDFAGSKTIAKVHTPSTTFKHNPSSSFLWTFNCFFFFFFGYTLILFLCVCVCVEGVHACHCMCVEVRGQLVSVCSLFLPCGSLIWTLY